MRPDLPPCPVCGEQPIGWDGAFFGYVTRCDGKPAASKPRHTLYVVAANREEAEALWRKLASKEQAE